ncbi:muts domain V-domain-containing protein [Tuber borchii]|uniref:DNA mismatch repair protein MSH6 n=1 Tax=Tuber borchii TaxID=42251 RepID=A0A2T6ZBU3_TUBBO|nr:muts domain V-domain-containing protein [Tuber borchii]
MTSVKADIEKATIGSDDFVVPDGAPTRTPRKSRDSKKRKKSNNDLCGTPSSTVKAPASTSRFVFNPKSGNSTPVSSVTTHRPKPPTPAGRKDRDEVRYFWLAEIKDADGNPPDHPDYDPRTLFVPPSAWLKFSPFEKQYWEIKSKLYDTVVFFKKGKFYELYEDDATIGHREFDLKLTDRVNMRMVGVPESSLDMWAAQFIAKGYKIARVDQKETALGKEMREKGGKAGKEEKIIRRELACVLTGGTLVDESMLQDEMATYCVAIKESFVEGEPSFGIAFVDTATGEFSLSEFEDDLELTKFETFLAQIRPRELIIEKGSLSSQSTRLLKNNTSLTTIWNKLKPGVEFWEGSTTIRELTSKDYFNEGSSRNGECWPQALEEAREKELAMSAFGALLCYLQTLKIDHELVSLGNFRVYDPIKKASSLILDGQTLLNLEIFANSSDGGSAGTLFSLLNRCITPFGKRMFKQWVCHPLADSAKINARLDAVESLNSNNGFQEAFVTHLNKMPDLERLISRIHAGSSRAADFLRVLEGFEQIRDAMDEITLYNEGGGLISQLLASMPDLKGSLEHWESAFDREKAKMQGLLVPERGVELDFDASQDAIEAIINVELEALLNEYKSNLKTRDIRYTDNGKEIYLIEVPVKSARNIPKSWTQMSGTQKVKRFYSPEVKKLVRSLQEAQETHSQIVKEVAGRFYKRFDKDYQTWLGAVKIVASLDCLISLARSSASLGETSCRPTFVEGERSVLDFIELRHPCMASSLDDFIPNDVQLGGDFPKISLLTGANAAGKSTVLRMTCVGVIMAQIGCFVPAKSARLTPVDRIMSRLGANDNIFAAQSTFFVELSETKKILTEATPHSLVILDELGRGTSSYDGVAVAQSVLHHVATHIGCLGFFATHYHSLASEFVGHPEIHPQRMQIHVDQDNRDITFLYKLEVGVAEGSFGMHCAAMCGINKRIIDRAEDAARSFEHTSRLRDSLEAARVGIYIPLGIQSDLAWVLRDENGISDKAFDSILKCIKAL